MDSTAANDMQAQAKTPSIGWIGAGKMGAPMIRNLLAAGMDVVVTEPNAAVRASLGDAGARAVKDLSPMASADIVFATLPNDQALRDVVLGTPDMPGLAGLMRRGAVFVEMSTVSPACSAEISVRLQDSGISYVRAPLSGSTSMAEAATLTVLASGDEAGWTAALPSIRVISSRQFFLGPQEEARYMKLVLNTLVGASSAILAEAVALGSSGGLSRAAMMDVICESAVTSPLFKYKADLVVSQDYSPAFTIQQMMKDFTLISDAGRANGVPMMTAGLILELYRAAANAGLQNEDFFALVKWHSGISAQ